MRRTVAPLLVLAALLAGCGNNSAPEAPTGRSQGSAAGVLQVPETDVARVVQAIDVIAQQCQSQGSASGASTTGTNAAPSPTELNQAVAILRQVYRDGPESVFQYGGSSAAQSMTTVVRHQADQLQGCGAPQAAAQLRQVLNHS